MNAALDYLAAKPPWAVSFAIWVLLAGLTGSGCLRYLEVCRDDDTPAPAAVPPGPVTIDLGLLERT